MKTYLAHKLVPEFDKTLRAGSANFDGVAALITRARVSWTTPRLDWVHVGTTQFNAIKSVADSELDYRITPKQRSGYLDRHATLNPWRESILRNGTKMTFTVDPSEPWNEYSGGLFMAKRGTVGGLSAWLALAQEICSVDAYRSITHGSLFNELQDSVFAEDIASWRTAS